MLRHNRSLRPTSDELSFVEWVTENAPGMTGHPGDAVKLLASGRLGLAAATKEAEKSLDQRNEINSFE
ncbi:hypothetical protein W823_14645 [Williamsia sp. D3]|nr:hypothetical protein W823_14645 [Williamsia sp. D3]